MGLGRRTFAPGEVLTASNVMNYLQDQVVMNFAGSAARGSAIGTAIQQGMVSYLNSTNALETYNGTTWNALALASAVPTLPQTGLRTVIPSAVTVSTGSGSFDSTSGLVSFTNANDINLNGIFTTAYNYYEIIYNIQANTGGAISILSYFTNNGTNIASGYYGASFYFTYTSTSGVQQARNNGTSSICGDTGQEYFAQGNIQVRWDNLSGYKAFKYTNYSTSNAQGLMGGYNTVGTCNGFRVSTGSARTLTGTMKVYGYN